MQHLVQEEAGMIARKRPAGSIRAVHAGREPNDQESGLSVAEWRNGLTVVISPDTFL